MHDKRESLQPDHREFESHMCMTCFIYIFFLSSSVFLMIKSDNYCMFSHHNHIL